eukprot:COSAG05_NODE_895_length_6700_cov_14.354189_7_plen_452_part_00
MNWAVNHGGGEYGSEDSSDSDLEEEEREAGISESQATKSWAEAMEDGEFDSDLEDGPINYSRSAMAGKRQTAKVGGFAGAAFMREGDAGDEDTEDDDGDDAAERKAFGQQQEHGAPGTKKLKESARQRAARRVKAKKKKAKADAAGAKSAQEEDERVARKLAGFAAKVGDQAAYQAPDGKTMYRSPLFPDLKIYSLEQLRFHMTSKKYKKAERQARMAKLTDKQREKLKETKAAKRQRKQARKLQRAEDAAATGQDSSTGYSADISNAGTPAGTPTAADDGADDGDAEGAQPKRKRKQTNGGAAATTVTAASDEQIAAKKAKFAAKKARRLARKTQGDAGSGTESSQGAVVAAAPADGVNPALAQVLDARAAVLRAGRRFTRQQQQKKKAQPQSPISAELAKQESPDRTTEAYKNNDKKSKGGKGGNGKRKVSAGKKPAAENQGVSPSNMR